MRKLFNVIERSFWHEGTGTKNWNYFSGSHCPKGFNLISFIVFYSAKKDLSMTLNSFFIIVAMVKQGLSWSSFPGNNFFCFSVIPAPTNHQWIFYISDITFLWLQSWYNNESSLFEHFWQLMWNSLFNIVICFLLPLYQAMNPVFPLWKWAQEH